MWALEVERLPLPSRRRLLLLLLMIQVGLDVSRSTTAVADGVLPCGLHKAVRFRAHLTSCDRHLVRLAAVWVCQVLAGFDRAWLLLVALLLFREILLGHQIRRKA